jgi:hypothetical protein
MRYYESMKLKKKDGYRSSDDPVVKQIESCDSGFALSLVIQKNPHLFQSNEAVKALIQSVDLVKRSMKKRDVQKLLTALSKTGVTRATLHFHQNLMFTMGEVALEKVDEFSPKQLASLVCAFSRVRAHGALCSRLYEKVAIKVVSDSVSVSGWEEIHLVAIAYAFMKANHMNADLFDTIGRELLMRGDAEIFYDGRQLGNLAAAYGKCNSLLTAGILELVFEKFQSLHADEFDLQNVADISAAIPLGHHLKVVPPGFSEKMTRFAIEKAEESRHEDTRCILLNFSRIRIDGQLRRQLMITYRPIFHSHSRFMSAANRLRIGKMYKKYGPLSSASEEM